MNTPDSQGIAVSSHGFRSPSFQLSSTIKPHPSSYDDWALYYDVIHEGLPGDVEFYVSMALANGEKTLELGTGTGRIAIPMAMAGVEVAGLDNSPAMLALCREKAALAAPFSKPFRLIEADMAVFNLRETFPFIAMPYRGFMHLLSHEEQRGCLNSVRRHLAPNGIFALDTWAAQPKQVAFLARGTAGGKPRLVGRYKTDDARVTVVHRCRAALDEVRQWLFEEHLIEERDQRGRLLHTSKLGMTRAYFSLDQLQAMTHECGFETIRLHGDFAGAPFDAKSRELIMILRKTRD